MASSRGATWSHDEILALIRIWADRFIQESLNKSKRHGEKYKKITEDFTKTKIQVEAKLRTFVSIIKISSVATRKAITTGTAGPTLTLLMLY